MRRCRYSVRQYCEKNDIVARIIITDASARLEKIGALGLRGVAAKARINGNPTELNILLETDAFANPKFSNVFKFTLGRNVDDHVGKREDVCSVPNFEKLDSMQVEYGNYNFLKNFPKRLCPAPIGTKVYRILGNYEAPKCENCKTEISLLNEIILQIPTNKGDLILKVPPFDPSISQIIKSCKSN